MGSNRSFGFVICVVCVLIAIWPTLHGESIRIIWSSIAVVFGGIALGAPGLLSWPNRMWFRFGILLGAIVAPVVMLLVYVTTFVPIGLMLRAFGKDLLSLEIDENSTSYWIERKDKPQSMTRQF